MTKLRSDEDGGGSVLGGGAAWGLKRKSSLVGMWKEGDASGSSDSEEVGNGEEEDASGEE
jgi:hypothetical protein